MTAPRFVPAFFFSLTVSLLVVNTGCAPVDVSYLEPENLFALELGRLEDQVDLVQLPGVPFASENNLIMKDGMFFIANGNGSKVMQFNSYGDIITLFYNDEVSPPPILLPEESPEGVIVNRRAVSYPFRELGDIAVDSRDVLLVEDVLPQSRWERNGPDDTTVYNRVVLRFDQDGEYRDFLGRNGVGGDPFPSIESIRTNDRDEIIVHCRVPEGHRLYWFDNMGSLLFPIDIPSDGLPLPNIDGVVGMIESVHPDPSEALFHVKADYFVPRAGESGLQFIQSVVHSYDARTGGLVRGIDIPKNPVDAGDGQDVAVEAEALYLLLGVAEGGVMVLFSPSLGRDYRLTLLDSAGQVVEDAMLNVSDDEPIFYSMFHLSEDGILSALLCRRFEAEVVWWRTDNLIRKYGDEGS
jgi:hypothetical protein